MLSDGNNRLPPFVTTRFVFRNGLHLQELDDILTANWSNEQIVDEAWDRDHELDYFFPLRPPDDNE